MAQQAVEFGRRIVIRGTLGTEEIVNVMHIRQPTETATDEQIANAFSNLWVQASTMASPLRGLRNFLPTDGYNFGSISVQHMDTVPWPDPSEFLYDFNGQADFDPLPNQTALVVSLRSGVGGRRGRGRHYLAPFAENGNDNVPAGPGRPTSALVVAAANAMQDLGARLATLECVLGIYSPTDGVIRSVGQVRVSNIWATQRRRAEEISATQTVVVN